MANCLVLGANGFLGSHLVDSLVEHGHTVIAFDRFKDGTRSFEDSPKIKVVAGDFLNRHDLAESLRQAEYVFHFISTTTPATAEDDPLIDIETNIRMSVELFQECIQAGVKRVIFASTGGAIYGINSSDHAKETDIPLPVSPYAIGKLTIEHYLRYFEKKFGLESLTFRISNPYGERQSLTSRQGVVPIFLQYIARGEPVPIMGDGSMVRDYIYVKDVARMIVESFQGARQSLYNLGSGHGLTINEVVAAMRTVTGKKIGTTHIEKPTTFVQNVVLDTTLFSKEFNGTKKTSIEDGFRSTWEYVQGHTGQDNEI